jgi:hypothetical protein
MSERKAGFTTDTATMCIFDPDCLKHRLQDDADWWSVPSVELEEMNAGHVAFVSLTEDGRFLVAVVDSLVDPSIRVNISSPSGRVFIGAGEEVTSDGLQPECVRGGLFLAVAPGAYLVEIQRVERHLFVSLHPTLVSANEFTDSLRI